MAGNGYAKLHPVGIMVRADMLETVAGYTDVKVKRELAFALSCADINDPATLRWLACLLARQIDTTEAHV